MFTSVQKPRSLWAETAVSTIDHPCLNDEIEADVTIIGAGFTGLRAALKLSEEGVKVVVLDAFDVAYGASGRNGGQINPILPFNTPDKLRKILGATFFERLTEISLSSADELFKDIKHYQIACQARQNGWLRVCHSKQALKETIIGVKEWNKFGANMEIIDHKQVEQKSGTRAYKAGVITPKGGAVQPLSLAIGLANAAKQNGCSIYGQSAVTSLKRQENKWIAKTAKGSIKSDWVIVATNGYSDDLIPQLATSIIPVTTIQIATDPLSQATIETILPEGHTISDSRRVIMYARRESDNRIVYGGHGKVYPDGSLGGVKHMIKDAVRVFPQLKDVKWTYRWGGRIAITDDYLPHLHEPKPGILIGLGYNGRGVAMSNVMGRTIAQRILGHSSNSLPFPTSQIRDIPFRAIKTKGISTAIWFMRFMDYLETR